MNNEQSSIIENKVKILVVEDEIDANDLFVSLIATDQSYIPYSAKDGIDALAILEKENIDLVLLDIVMPKMDGIQTLREIKQNPDKYGKPLIVMLTNLSGDSTTTKTEELKADGYILKIDTEPEQLLEQIKKILEKKI